MKIKLQTNDMSLNTIVQKKLSVLQNNITIQTKNVMFLITAVPTIEMVSSTQKFRLDACCS